MLAISLDQSYLERKAAEIVLHTPDPQKLYHCWNYCKVCKRTYSHSQADWNSIKERECCNNPNNLITVSANIPMVRI